MQFFDGAPDQGEAGVPQLGHHSHKNAHYAPSRNVTSRPVQERLIDGIDEQFRVFSTGVPPTHLRHVHDLG